ncbi:MAG: phosphatase PAP2 family protein [Bacteroidota bacterium]|nr:phosphatase PAP2 family protein [Bacteroidota bacterium]
MELLRIRLLMILGIIILAYFNSIKNWWMIRFSRFAFIGALLIYWYPETFDINRLIPNYDFLLARLEQAIFGFQPALVFCQHFPQHWFGEILNMGYFAYYPLIIGTSMYFYLKSKRAFEQFFFIVLFSFFSYYLIYIIFPTAGPQYYYQAIGLDQVNSGIFPNIGFYFNKHQTLISVGNNSGFFSQMVQHTQQVGERPTAAFPSSHVGISTIIMLLVIKNRQYFLLAFILPIYLALVAATVYIQAHYVIDVFAGLMTAFLFCYLGNLVYRLFTHKLYGIPELTAIFSRKPIKLRN